MLGRINRFHGHNGVRRVYRQGKQSRNALASIHVLQNDKLKSTKAAVVVSRKTDKSAVRRNRIRRRLYEIVRAELPKIKTPVEMVITVYSPDIAQMPSNKLKTSTKELFKKARL